MIPTLKPGKPLRLAFGSCRTSVEHDEEGNKTHGVDALRAYALAMARVTVPDGDLPEELPWPDMVLFLGDQVYADETTAGHAGLHRGAARHRAGRRGPSSRTTRSTPSSTAWRGRTP